MKSNSPAPQIIRVVGYGLLAFAGIDLLFQLLGNPFGGALQAFRFSSGLVDRTPVPLLALGVLLAFPRVMPLPIERTVMKLLSYVPFIYAGGFLLVIASALITGNRLIVVAEQQITSQSQAQMRQLETTVDRVKTLDANELQAVVSNFNQQNRTTLKGPEFMTKLTQQTDAQKAQLKIGTERALGKPETLDDPRAFKSVAGRRSRFWNYVPLGHCWGMGTKPWRRTGLIKPW